MSHTEIDAQFPERYVLNRLSDGERAAFEEHLVDCQDCQEALRTAGALRQGLKAVRAEFPSSAKVILFRGRQVAAWQGFALAAACLVLALIPSAIWYRQAAESRGRETVALADAASLRAELARRVPNQGAAASPVYPLELVRGAEESITQLAISKGADSVILVVPRVATQLASKAELQDASGRTVWTLAAIPAGSSDSVGLTVPANLLAPGKYVLLLHSGGKPVARFAFQVAAAQ